MLTTSITSCRLNAGAASTRALACAFVWQAPCHDSRMLPRNAQQQQQDSDSQQRTTRRVTYEQRTRRLDMCARVHTHGKGEERRAGRVWALSGIRLCECVFMCTRGHGCGYICRKRVCANNFLRLMGYFKYLHKPKSDRARAATPHQTTHPHTHEHHRIASATRADVIQHTRARRVDAY